jgi:hypothetical protein
VIPADTLTNTETRNYSIDITYNRGGTRADTYLIGNGVKILANANTRLIVGGPYQFKSVETASILLGYDSDSMTVLVSIFNNTGGNLTLIPQTITVSMVQYDAPITSI